MTSNNQVPGPISTKRVFLSLVAATFVCGVSAPALAHSGAEGRASGLRLTTPQMRVAPDADIAPMVPPLRLAEVEVVNSNPPAAAPAAAPVAAAPVVAQEPVVAPRHEVVHHHEGSYMGTIALNALFGAVAGGLVGGALYYLSDDQTHAQRIAYWAAGGVLVGAGIGVVQIMADSRTESVAMSKLPHDPAPTYRLALLTTRF
jgi:MFS family permease